MTIVEIRQLATKEELRKLRVAIVLWIVGMQVLATAVILGALAFFSQR